MNAIRTERMIVTTMEGSSEKGDGPSRPVAPAVAAPEPGGGQLFFSAGTTNSAVPFSLSLSLSLSLRRAGAVATFGRSQTWKRPFRPAGPLGLIVVREEMERGEPDCRLSTPLYLMERGKLDRSTAQSQSETDSSVAGLVVFFFGLVF